MIRDLWTVFCALSVTDGETRNVSLINVLERMRVTIVDSGKGDGRWVIPMSSEVVTLWERGELAVATKGMVRVEIYDNHGEALGKGEVDIDLTDSMRCRSRTTFNAFPVTGSGRYLIRTTLFEEGIDEPRVVNEYPFDVSVTLQPAEAPLVEP